MEGQVAGIVLNNCTIIIHIEKKDFVEIIRDLVDEGIITPAVAEQLIGDENDRTS